MYHVFLWNGDIVWYRSVRFWCSCFYRLISSFRRLTVIFHICILFHSIRLTLCFGLASHNSIGVLTLGASYISEHLSYTHCTSNFASWVDLLYRGVVLRYPFVLPFTFILQLAHSFLNQLLKHKSVEVRLDRDTGFWYPLFLGMIFIITANAFFSM